MTRQKKNKANSQKLETKRRRHDSFFKYVYSVPENMQTLLLLAQNRTPELQKMLSDVDMESLEPIPGSFSTVGEHGEGDLAFKAKSLTGGPAAFVGILLEHKSVRENDVLSQIYHYVFEVMVNKNNFDFRWLPTKAIIIYNGKSCWDPIAEFKRKGYAKFNGNDLPFECVMVDLSNIQDEECKHSKNPIAAIGTLVMKHAYDLDGLRGAGEIIKDLLGKLDNNTRATLVKKIELYLKWYIDKNLVKEMIMAFKSIGQRMGFVSIADAERMAAAKGRREGRQIGLKEGRQVGLKEGLKEGRQVGLKEGLEKGVQKGVQTEQANSERKMNLFVKRIAKKMNISEKELLALKP